MRWWVNLRKDKIDVILHTLCYSNESYKISLNYQIWLSLEFWQLLNTDYLSSDYCLQLLLLRPYRLISCHPFYRLFPVYFLSLHRRLHRHRLHLIPKILVKMNCGRMIAKFTFAWYILSSIGYLIMVFQFLEIKHLIGWVKCLQICRECGFASNHWNGLNERLKLQVQRGLTFICNWNTYMETFDCLLHRISCVFR